MRSLRFHSVRQSCQEQGEHREEGRQGEEVEGEMLEGKGERRRQEEKGEGSVMEEENHVEDWEEEGPEQRTDHGPF